MAILVISSSLLALIAGLLFNRFAVPRILSGEDPPAMAIKELISPLLSLTVLLLAFVLVSAAGSYGKAEEASRAEARALDQISEAAEYVPVSDRLQIQADAVCYARAVASEEWDSMQYGKGSPVPSIWSTDLRRVFKSLEEDSAFSMLVAADVKRSDEREERLTQSTASVPVLVFWFLLVTLIITISSLGACLPLKKNRGHVVALSVLTALLAAILCIIQDVDQPYNGLIKVNPTAISEIERQAHRDLMRAQGSYTLPCGENGKELREKAN
ncbi:hypothetical protein ACFWVB_38830 [Streptomyces microflavus]|uniref:bestrophin-like domain n=1 Tax=Streptomyces microflavus TaxID=1919 RepID=UPI0036539EAA